MFAPGSLVDLGTGHGGYAMLAARLGAGRPVIIDTHLAHGTPEHRLSDPVEHLGYTGRLYREPGKLTSSWGNDESFWPTLESFHRMLNDCGFPVVLTAEPWVKSSRGIFVALP